MNRPSTPEISRSNHGDCNTAIIPSTRPDYDADRQSAWLTRHTELVAQARNGGIDVAFFGDSLIEHWSVAGRATWERFFAPLGAANFGVAGDRTQQVLWRMTNGELDGFAPKVFVVLIGTNNTDPGLGENSLTPRNTPREIIAGITEILRLVRDRFPKARIILHGLLPRGTKDAPVRTEIAEINTALRQLETDSPRLRFLDMTPFLISSDGSLGAGFRPDLIHLNEDGYRAWAGLLLGPLKEMLAESR